MSRISLCTSPFTCRPISSRTNRLRGEPFLKLLSMSAFAPSETLLSGFRLSGFFNFLVVNAFTCPTRHLTLLNVSGYLRVGMSKSVLEPSVVAVNFFRSLPEFSGA